MANPTYNSISTNTISSGQIAVSTLYARTVSSVNVVGDTFFGDGTYLSNINWLNITGTIPTSKYQAYSIPWMAMADTGSINLRAGTWLHGGLISPSSLSVITSVETSTLVTPYALVREALISSLIAPTISSFYISTHALQVETNWFTLQWGDEQHVGSSYVHFLSTYQLNAGRLVIDNLITCNAVFSSMTTGAFTVKEFITDTLGLYDYGTKRYTTLSVSSGILFVSTSSIYEGVATGANISTAASNILLQLAIQSNALNPHPTFSVFSTLVNTNFLIFQSSVSSLSTTIGTSCNFASNFTITASNTLQSNINALSNNTSTNQNQFSTQVGTRIGNAETFATNSSNYFQTQTDLLRGGLSTGLSNLSTSVGISLYTLTLSSGSNFTNLYASVSSIGLLMANGISTTWSTLSTLDGSNASILRISLSTSISNLSIQTSSAISLTNSNMCTSIYWLSTMWGSTFSTLVDDNVSTLSTGVGRTVVTIQEGLSTVWSTLSTITGSNFSATQQALSSFSTYTSSNFSDIRGGLSTVAAILSTTAGSNMSTLQFGLSTLSTSLGSNTSTLQTGLSSFSTVTGSNFSSLRVGLSTLSTSTGEAINSYSTSVGQANNSYSTLVGQETSTLRVGISTVGTDLRSGFSSFSTITWSNFSILQVAVSSVSSGVAALSNVVLIGFSTLSTTIGTTSNFLTTFSTLSTSIASNFFITQEGLSTLSTGIANAQPSFSTFSTLRFLVSSISSGNINALSLSTQSLSTSVSFFQEAQGSTMSSLTQQIGVLLTTQMTASSFSGNLNDAQTVLIQFV